MFTAKCNHVISRGKNKGNLCGKDFAISDIPGGIKLHRKKWLCSKCNKLKMYKDKDIEYYDAKEIPVKINNHSNIINYIIQTEEKLTNFLEKNYKFYMKNKEWKYIHDINNDDIKFIKI